MNTDDKLAIIAAEQIEQAERTAESLGEIRLALTAVIDRLDRIERELGEINAAGAACTCGDGRLVGSVQGLPYTVTATRPTDSTWGFYDDYGAAKPESDAMAAPCQWQGIP